MTSNLRILVVEDDYINQLYMKSLLSGEGIHVDSAANGLQALEKYDQNTYHVILMDAQMPKMDGFEATRIIREKEKAKNIHTPIFALTGYAVSNVEENFSAAGVDEFLLKPLDENKLIYLIKKYTAAVGDEV